MGMHLLDFDSSPAPELLPEKPGKTAVAIRENCEVRPDTLQGRDVTRHKRVEDVEDVPAKFRAKQQEVVKFCRMVVGDVERLGKGMEECCLLVAMNYAEAFPILTRSGQGGKSQLTYNNCRNWLRLIGKTKDGERNFANSAVLCDNYVCGTREMKKWHGDPQFWKAFWGFWLNRNCLAATTAYRLAVAKTKKENAFAVIPKYSNVQYRIAQMHPAEVALARRGEEALKTGFISYIDRNWDNIRPGFMLVADNRQFDVFVKVWDDENQKWKAARPYICAAIDGKSWYLNSFIITTDSINNDHIAIMLGNHIHNNGNMAPSLFYVDNGKDFNAQGFAQPVELEGYQHSTFLELAINTLNSIAYNAKAKTVERYFRDMMMEFDKMFPSYLGSRPGERPDTAAFYQKNPEKLLSCEEFTQVFGAWLDKYQDIPKHGKIHQGKSPREIWESRIPLSEPMSDARLFMAFLKPDKETRTISRGPKIEVNSNLYYSQELWPHFGKPVMVKTDRFDDSHVYAFKVDGTFICECRTQELIEAVAKDPESLQRIKEAMALQRRQIKNTYTAVNKLTGGLHVLSPGQLLVAAPDVEIIRDGEKNSVRGASHKFVNYIPKEMKASKKFFVGELETAVPPTAPVVEFPKNRKSSIDLEFQRKLDATLLRSKPAENKTEKEEFTPADFAGDADTKTTQEEMRDELDKDFN